MKELWLFSRFLDRLHVCVLWRLVTVTKQESNSIMLCKGFCVQVRSGCAVSQENIFRIKDRPFKLPQTLSLLRFVGPINVWPEIRHEKGRNWRGTSVTGGSTAWLWQPMPFTVRDKPISLVTDQVTEDSATIFWDRVQAPVDRCVWATLLLMGTPRKQKHYHPSKTEARHEVLHPSLGRSGEQAE